MTRERKKRKKRGGRPLKGTCVGVTDREGSLRKITEDLRLHVVEILQSIELAPQTQEAARKK